MVSGVINIQSSQSRDRIIQLVSESLQVDKLLLEKVNTFVKNCSLNRFVLLVRVVYNTDGSAPLKGHVTYNISRKLSLTSDVNLNT